MIPRILWHMGSGILRRHLTKPKPGALLHYPGVWKSRAGLLDCALGAKLPENAYFRNMELAIWYGCGLQGILHACAKKHWYFVFGSQGIRHYKDIRAGQAFEVHTQNIYWDDTWFFLFAQFKCPDTGEVFADGLSRVMLRHGRSPVDSRELYALMGVHDIADKTGVPGVVAQFLDWDAAAEASMKATADANARAYAGSARPPFLSAHSMNLPFPSSRVKEEAI
ncbi:hypothetical protein PybrP1_009151 [[Pythium] brassicae (nom. inval.)]|nr:hypothetical protein PybrP1_009151 [[Pythium] brassicae (nom. inval.)]